MLRGETHRLAHRASLTFPANAIENFAGFLGADGAGNPRSSCGASLCRAAFATGGPIGIVAQVALGRMPLVTASLHSNAMFASEFGQFLAHGLQLGCADSEGALLTGRTDHEMGMGMTILRVVPGQNVLILVEYLAGKLLDRLFGGPLVGAPFEGNDHLNGGVCASMARGSPSLYIGFGLVDGAAFPEFVLHVVTIVA
ncbi:MAG: hypothetical protein MJE77_08565 [Proteobacteria bacterium]|nr:hypothetical protein [Pseudomonadota bacterium]